MSNVPLAALFSNQKGNTVNLQAISVGFGKETFSSSSCSLAAFHVTEGFQREVLGKAFSRQGQLQRFPASAYPEVNGYLYLDTVKVPDNQIILLQASHRYLGRPLRDGALVLRTRATGPMYVIRAVLPTAPEATQTGDFLVFQGRADILDPDELSAYSINVPKHYREGFMDITEINECYQIDKLSEETERQRQHEQVTDADGNTVVVPKRPGRRIRFRP